MYKGELMLTAIKLVVVTTVAILNLLLVGGYVYFLDKGNVVAAEMLSHYSVGTFFAELTVGVMYGIYSLLKKY